MAVNRTRQTGIRNLKGAVLVVPHGINKRAELTVNAAFGQFGLDLLTASTRALKSGSATNDGTYASIETSIGNLTTQRDALVAQIRAALSGAAFDGRSLKEQQAKAWIAQAQSLLDQAHALAAG